MKIVKIDIYNMVKDKELLTLDINQSSITFLTGYNGTCKLVFYKQYIKLFVNSQIQNFQSVEKSGA